MDATPAHPFDRLLVPFCARHNCPDSTSNCAVNRNSYFDKGPKAIEYELQEGSMNDIEPKILEVASALAQDEIDLLEGCRQLVQLQTKLNSKKDLFLPLIGIVSETDDFPIGEERIGWQPDALIEFDRQRDEYLLRVKKIILCTCKEIISEFSKKG